MHYLQDLGMLVLYGQSVAQMHTYSLFSPMQYQNGILYLRKFRDTLTSFKYYLKYEVYVNVVTLNSYLFYVGYTFILLAIIQLLCPCYSICKTIINEALLCKTLSALQQLQLHVASLKAEPATVSSVVHAMRMHQIQSNHKNALMLITCNYVICSSTMCMADQQIQYTQRRLKARSVVDSLL